MKRLAFIAGLMALAMSFASPAEARPHHHRHHHHHRRHHAHVMPHPGGMDGNTTGRPSVCYGIPWCGCWLRVQLGIADTRYNAASWWTNYGHRISGPVEGAIARFHHHVGLVVGVDGKGNPIVKSGNHHKRVGVSTYPKHRVLEYRIQ